MKGLCLSFLFSTFLFLVATPTVLAQDKRVDYVAAVVEYAPTYSFQQVNQQEAFRIMSKNLDGSYLSP